MSQPSHRPARRAAFVVLGALALIALLAGLSNRDLRRRVFQPEAPEPVAPPALAAEDDDAPGTGAAATPRCADREPVLLEGRYVLSYRSDTTVAGAAGGHTKSPGPVHASFEASLDAKPLPAAPGAAREVALRLVVRASDLSAAAGRLGLFGGATLRDALAEPWTMRVGPDGLLAEAQFPSRVPPSVQAMLHQLAEAAQVTWPASCAPAEAWQGEERQLNGPVRASYTRKGDALRKRLADDQATGVYRLEGSGAFVLDGARIETLDYRTTTHVRMQSAGQLVTADSDLSVRLRRESPAPELALAPPSDLRPLDRGALTASVTRATDRAAVRGRSVGELVTALEEGGKKGLSERGLARGDLVSALRLTPAAATEVAEKLRQSTVGSVLERSLLEALVSAGTAQADALVRTLVADRDAPKARRQLAVIASGFTAHPTAALGEALALTAQERGLEVAAIVAEANVVGTLLRQDHTAGTGLLAGFLPRAEAALPPTEIGPGSGDAAHLNRSLAWIQALGALRAPEVLPVLERALADEEPWVRAGAAYALRFHPTDHVRELVSRAALFDPSPGVRESAALACLQLGRGLTLEVVEKVLTTDEVAWVRLAAADVIGAWALYRPGLRRVLEAALPNEKDETVRDALRKYITPGTGLENAERLNPWTRSSRGSTP